MNIDSVRSLKASLLGSVVRDGSHPTESIALGISGQGPQSYRLAVRIQDPDLQGSPELDAIVRQANGEAETAFLGTVQSGNAGFGVGVMPENPVRPLAIGSSVGQSFNGGTLGCFVRSRQDGKICLLSNTHVLGADDEPTLGAKITQPSRFFGGSEVVAALTNFVNLRADLPNLVDCAVAALADGMVFDPATVGAIGKLNGRLASQILPQIPVAKLGHGTNTTSGKVTAIEICNLVVSTETGSLRFDGQIEISADNGPVANLDDCGSLMIDGSQSSVALLFAVSRSGNVPGQVAYANPLDRVLNALNVALCTTIS